MIVLLNNVFLMIILQSIEEMGVKMPKFSTRQIIKYKFDVLMSKGTAALIGALSIVSFSAILTISLLVWLFKASPEHNFPEIIWMSLMRAMDAGTIGGDEGSIVYLFLMFVITLAGIFILSILIGLLTSGIENKIESLRKGKSLVIEKNPH